MSTRLDEVIARFTGLRLLVIGESMLDVYTKGTTRRLCREAPVPVVDEGRRTVAPGGAANTAANLARLGARVELLSVIGDDGEGAELRATLGATGAGIEHVLVEPGRTTLTKRRVIADGQLVVRLDSGTREPAAATTRSTLRARLRDLFADIDGIVLSDYGYGVLDADLIAALEQLQRRSARLVVADGKRLAALRRIGVTAAKPNFGEAVELAGRAPEPGADRAAWVAEHAETLLEVTGARVVAVTLDTDGAVVLERGRAPYRTYTRPTAHARAAGAGDTFTAALALALAAGAHVPAAAELASAASSIVVGRDGTTTCGLVELREYFSSAGKYYGSAASLAVRLGLHRQLGHRVVLTNGCFDILHGGHITYLNRAKSLGDVLVVGVNTDETIRLLKGPDRPINTLGERAEVLAALSCVDYVVPFAEETPIELVRAIRPDVFVKGGDYRRETLPEAETVEELGGRVHLLPYVANRSTTGIIERIRSLPPSAGQA